MPSVTPGTENPIDQYIQAVRKDKQVTPSRATPTYRRLVGAVFGGTIALAYGVVAQIVSGIDIPGVALYQPPLGPQGNILLVTAGGIALGLATAWPANGWRGVLAGSLVGVILLFLRAQLIPGSSSLLGQVDRVMSALLDMLTIPVAFLIALPIGLLLRWAVDEECAQRQGPWLSWKRVRLPLLLIGGALLAALSSRYPADVRADLAAMDVLLRAGQVASTPSELPEPLQRKQVQSFLFYGQGRYALEWQAQPMGRVSEEGAAGVSGPGSPQTIVAHFDNGYRVSCLFTVVGAAPRCQSN
jgi:hypothetical protein